MTIELAARGILLVHGVKAGALVAALGARNALIPVDRHDLCPERADLAQRALMRKLGGLPGATRPRRARFAPGRMDSGA